MPATIPMYAHINSLILVYILGVITGLGVASIAIACVAAVMINKKFMKFERKMDALPE